MDFHETDLKVITSMAAILGEQTGEEFTTYWNGTEYVLDVKVNGEFWLWNSGSFDYLTGYLGGCLNTRQELLRNEHVTTR